jgi:hypothetical protein
VMAMPAPLADRDYVDIWVDGLHFNVRLEEPDRGAWSSSASA